MKKPFAVRDNLVLLQPFQVEWRAESTGEIMTRDFNTHERAEQFAQLMGGTVTEVDVSAIAWMEGLEVAGFDEALAIYEQGEDAYRAGLAEAAQKSPDQLRADVDFISAMTGVTLV